MLTDWQMRVIDEYASLCGMRKALVAALNGTARKNLDAAQVPLMERQHHAMLDYESVLRERIEAFSTE
jgi:pyruvate-formate lyase